MRPDSLLQRCALALTGVLLGVGIAWAATPGWKDLSLTQQSLITPALVAHGGNFDQLPAPRRAALVRGADRWLSMTPAQRTTATQQFQQWQLMSAAEKRAVLDRRERFRKLSDDERKALLETREQFMEMPLQQQIELHQQFNDLQPQLEGLPSQQFSAPGSPNSGGTAPLGLPTTALPGGNNSTAIGLPPS